MKFSCASAAPCPTRPHVAMLAQVGEEPGASAGTVNWVRPESHESAQLMRLMANHTSNFSMINHY